MKNVTEKSPSTPPKRVLPDRRKCILTLGDAIFSSLVVAPFVVGYWRSVWELMGIFVWPNDPLISALISTCIGIGGHIFFTMIQNVLDRSLTAVKKKNSFFYSKIVFGVCSRLYTVIFAFVCVNGWRGPWSLLDLYQRMDTPTVVTTTIVGIVALTAMRTLRNISAPPFAILLDYSKGYFEVLTMFRVSIAEKKSLYILDCLFSVLIVGTLVVFVWRGVWALFDIYLYPDNDIKSAWASLILGYAIVAVAFLLQPIMRWLCDRFKGAARLLTADIFILFSFIGTINVWRGIWNLLNLYILPDNLELSCWITHWVCLIILVLLGCSNSLLVRGVYIDAEEPAGKCVVFPCYYLRVIFQEKKRDKAQSNICQANGNINKAVFDVETAMNGGQTIISGNDEKHKIDTYLNNVVVASTENQKEHPKDNI